MKSFASDNYAGAVPEVMQALLQENQDHAPAYGNDNTTSRLQETFNAQLGTSVLTRLVFNGTGANLCGLSCMVEPYSAILCAETAHIYVDESTASEALTGCRLFPLPVDNNGKLTPESIEQAVKRQGDLHHPQIQVLSLTQPTEYGTLYSLEELQKIKAVAERHHLAVHLDGSRIFIAAAALNCSLKDIIFNSGAAVVSVGGTKIGLLYGEAVLIIDKDLQQKAPFFHKRSMQLASKNRFIAAQFLALLENDTWKKYSKIALTRAQQLAGVLQKYTEITLTKPVQANAVFAVIPQDWIKPLQDTIPFYVWEEATNEVRLMCAFDTTEADIELFDTKLAALKQAGIVSNS